MIQSLSQIRLVPYRWVQCRLAYLNSYYLQWVMLIYSEAGDATFSIDERWVCICVYMYVCFYLIQ